MADTMSLKDVLRGMDKGVPFDMEVVTCDVGKGTGGKIRVYSRVILSGKNLTPALSINGEGDVGRRGVDVDAEKLKKSPNHYENSTRNIYDPKQPQRQRIRKVHLRLIISFNGRTVI